MGQIAAVMLEASEDAIVFENGMVGEKGAPAKSRPYAATAGYAYGTVPRPAGLETALSNEASSEPENNTSPFDYHISMHKIDRDTGEPKLLKLVAVDDA